MKSVAILTDFISHDPAYSLCVVVANQAKMIAGAGVPFKVIVRPGFDHAYHGAEIIVVVAVRASAYENKLRPG